MTVDESRHAERLEAVGRAVFDEIYATDLRYLKDCWTLCGDAHCCSFARYKARFRLLARTPFQELPLLPGEFQYLREKGWLEQFGDFDHKGLEFALDSGPMLVDSIVSRRPHCACDQATRPTVCRLYPLLPVFDVEGRLAGTDTMAIYDDLEAIEGLPRACALTGLPFAELPGFLRIAHAIGRAPLALFYVAAYRIAKHHARQRLAAARRQASRDVFAVAEAAFLRGRLLDRDTLAAELDQLALTFRAVHGDRFRLL